MGFLVFISYATKDAKFFKIGKIAEKITQYPEIEDALYWQEDADGSIITYMNENVPKCDIFILFCSKNTIKSRPIKIEWETAQIHDKEIIPIFTDIVYVPPLLRRLRGIQFNIDDIDDNIIKIYELIKKKLTKSQIPKKVKPTEPESGLISFRGGKISRDEVEFLMDLEEHLNRRFSLVEQISSGTKMGFKIENNKVIGIGLYDCELSSLPESIRNFKSLKELNISFNQLTKLPKFIYELSSLNILYANNNSIKTISKKIKNLQSLITLTLDYNNLESIPEEINNLKNLEILSTSGNPFEIQASKTSEPEITNEIKIQELYEPTLRQRFRIPERPMLKIMAAGEGGVGRTTLLYRYVEERFFPNTKMTLGIQFFTKNIEFHDTQYEVYFWDLAGQERWRPFQYDFISGADGAIFNIDLTRPATLNNIEKWINLLRLENPNLPILLLGLKIDLIDQVCVDDEEIDEYRDKFTFIDYLKVSCKTGENVEEAFDTLYDYILIHREM